MNDLIKILSTVASAKLSLLDTLKFADNVELTVHLHLGNELYPTAIVQVNNPNCEDKKAPTTFVLDETDEETEEELGFKRKELPFNIGSHIVLDEKFFSNSDEANFQHTKKVQFVPAYNDKALGVFMDGGGRTFNLNKNTSLSFTLDIPTRDEGKKKYQIKKNRVAITENEKISWEISKIKAGEYIKIPDDSLSIISFDEAVIACVFLISRKHYGHLLQHWVVAFPN